MELLLVNFVFAATILSVTTEGFLFRSVDFTDNADQKTAAATAHLLTGASGFRHKTGPSGGSTRHKRAVGHTGSVARPHYGKRASQVYPSVLEERDRLVVKRSATVYPEFDESNTDSFLGEGEAPGPSGYKGEAPGPTTGYKREAPTASRYPYKRSESLEVDESNTDYIILGKEEALAGPTAFRHHAGKRSVPVDVQQESFVYGKRAVPTSMDAE